MEMLRRFWNDEAGFVVSAELILIATILVIGLIVGLAVLRNQVVQELVDVGQAIGSISQSFCFSGTWKPAVAWTDGTCYIDLIDFCQSPDQKAFEEPGGISVRMFPIGFPPAPPGGEAIK
jgi:Flp pilus assembly pilin Flp